MDTKLSEFTTKTCCDPGLALDLLKSHQWSVKDALNAYYLMKGIIQEDQSNGLLAKEEIDSGLDLQFRLPIVSCGSLPSLPSPSSPPPEPLGSATSSTNSSPSKLALSKTDIRQDDLLNEIYPSKKLSRGISRATDNVNLVSRARNEFAQEFGASGKRSQIEVQESPSTESYSTLYIKAPETFTLPDLSIHPPDFSEFLEKDLIEKSSLISLQGAGRLNWWADMGICQRLWPLATSGDGNCLLHAASLGMWGFHDRLLTLRKALHAILSNSSYTNSFYRRWRWQSSIQNKAAGLILCEEEWQKEWATLLKMASTEPRVRASHGNNNSNESKKNGLTGGKKTEPLPEEELQPHVYESLEELHIMALAHVLHRPIIVVADTMLKDVTGEPFAPIPFGGIYLPLECNQGDCHRSPLCLTYDAAHFSALVAMDKETYADDTPRSPAAIPLVDSECNLLPLQFSIDPGPNVAWGKDENDDSFIQSKSPTFEQKITLLSKYLDILYINKSIGNSSSKSSSNNQSDTTGKSNSSSLNCGGENTYSSNKKAANSSPEKYATLPAKIELESKTSTLAGSISAQSEQLHGEKKSFKFFKHFHFISIRKRFGKRFRKNVTSFARSASLRFRRNSNSKVSTNSPNSNTKVNNERNDNCAKSASDVATATTTATTTSNNKNNTTTTTINNMKNANSSNTTNKSSTNPITITTTCAQSNNQFICAVLHAEKKPDYREEMIRNYLCSARFRFEQLQKDKELKSSTPRSSTASSTPSDSSSLSTTAHTAANPPSNSNSNCNSNSNYASQCVNSGCSNFGTATTSYLCSKCFQDQKEEMSKCEKEFGEKVNILNTENDNKSNNVDDSKKAVTKNFTDDDADDVDAGAAKKMSAHSLEINPSDNLTTGVSIRC